MTSAHAPKCAPLRSASRALLGGFALAALALAGIGRGVAAPQHHDSEAPVDFSADHMEVQDKAKRVILTGHVDIVQAELRLAAERTLMAYADGDKVTLHRIDATGSVVVTRNDEQARGDVAVYDLDRKLITMVGHVELHRANGDTLHGGRLVIDLDSGISNLDGHTATPAGAASPTAPSGRVSGTFNVPKKDDKPKP